MKTTSYEISKKLAEIGFKSNQGIKKYVGDQAFYSGSKTTHYIGFCLETILEALPKNIKDEKGRIHPLVIYFGTRNSFVYQSLCEKEINLKFEENETLSDTAARLLILLVEKGIINLKE